MADNVAITAGAGTTIASDDNAGVQHQIVKLMLGVNSSFVSLVDGTAIYGMFVDPRRTTVRVQVSPVLTNFGTLYTTGDCLGTLTTLANCARISGGGGRILGVQVVDKTQAQRSAFTILLFDRTVTTAADNAAFQVSDADALFCVGQIEVLSTHYNTAWPGTPLNSVATLPHNDVASTPIAMNVPFTCQTTSLFMQLVVRGAPTYTSNNDLVVSLIIEQD